MTAIEWVRNADGTRGKTVQVVAGCKEAGGPGCDNCYAIRFVNRLSRLPDYTGLVEGSQWTGVVRTLPHRWAEVARWRKPTTVFLNSLSDTFHPDVPTAYLAECFATMARYPQHTFQILTKRPGRYAKLSRSPEFLGAVEALVDDDELAWPLRNVWIGTSVEGPDYLWRVDQLAAAAAAIRFLSLEPLLVPLPGLDLRGIHWVIAGGETGGRARPPHPAWFKDLRDQCRAAKVAWFFKQWGAWAPANYANEDAPGAWVSPTGRFARVPAGPTTLAPLSAVANMEGAVLMRKVGKKKAGALLDGIEWREMPTVRGGPADWRRRVDRSS